MPGFLSRRWKIDGKVVEEETYPSEYATISELNCKTRLHGMYDCELELELVFDPPLLQLPPDLARQLGEAITEAPDTLPDWMNEDDTPESD